MDSEKWKVEKVISGGQTGADRVALEVAHKAGIETGGTAPRKFMTTAGPDLSLKMFDLVELDSDRGASVANQYILRSQKNVDAADATIVFRHSKSPGTDKTIFYARTHRWPPRSCDVTKFAGQPEWRPCFVADTKHTKHELIDGITKFLAKHKPKVVNVAGHRDDGSAECREFLATVRFVLTEVLK